MMTGLTADDMAELAALDELYMPDTCSVLRNTASPVGGNPGKPDFQPVAPGTPVSCRVSGTAQADEQAIALQLQGIEAAALYVPLGTDLRRDDRVLVKGERFQVLGVNAEQSYGTSLRALIKAVGATT